MKIAIASSGLGHVARGIETWALDTAAALEQLLVNRYSLSVVGKSNHDEPITNNPSPFAPLSVTLFSGDPVDSVRSQIGATSLAIQVLPCLKRGDGLTRLMARLAPGFTWRWGWKSTYDIEQRSFWHHLWPILRDDGYDILHVQDPLLADLCRRYREAGKLKTREILAHGTEETPEFLARFPYVQHLAPWHLEQVRGGGEEGDGSWFMVHGGNKVAGCTQTKQRPTSINHQPSTNNHQPSTNWVAIPNFVDCGVFRPSDAGELSRHSALRAQLGIPDGSFVVGCVAAVKKHHKRVDYLIREFACFCKAAKAAKEQNLPSRSSRASVQNSSPEPYLLIAGARTDESAELLALAESLIPGRYKILTNVRRDQMPDLYRAMDVFVLSSLFEMMPIALLEALASGVPCVVNRHPVLEWMVGVKEEKPETGNLRPELEGVGGRHETGNSESERPTTHDQRTTTHDQRPTNNDQPTTCPASSGGISIDMSREGVLAAALAGLTPDWIAAHLRHARDRALGMFSKDVVIRQYVDYYREVMGGIVR